MKNKIARPVDHYSADWAEYWKQNPGLHRGVGADAAEGKGKGEGEGDKGDKITPEMFQALQDTLTKVEANNKALLQEKLDSKKATDKAIEEAAKKNGDVEALEKSWSEKLATETKQRDEKLTEYQQMINRMTIGSEAQRLAAALALPGSADVLLPHIERRLQVEVKDGAPIVRVLDKDGKPSALSVADLQKEIEGNAAFAPLLVGSAANGSGRPGGKGEAGSKTMSRSDFDKLSASEQDAFVSDGGKPVDA